MSQVRDLASIKCIVRSLQLIEDYSLRKGVNCLKLGTKVLLPVRFGIDLDTVQSIDFIFSQYESTLEFTYPSEKAFRDTTEDIIKLIWNEEDTWQFSEGTVQMDTKIHLITTDYIPQTSVEKFTMTRTLFKPIL